MTGPEWTPEEKAFRIEDNFVGSFEPRPPWWKRLYLRFFRRYTR